MSILDDAFHKLERGKEQLVDFITIIRRNFDEKSFSYVIKAYPYSKPANSKDPLPWHLYDVHFETVPVFSKRDGILMGEIIQSFRSSLDYLAWALYSKSGVRVKSSQERQIAFPMLSNSTNLTREFDKRLPNVPASERTFIERYQPYQSTNSAMFIGWLNTLSNTDKHRVIIPVAVMPLDGKIEFVYGSWGKIITMIKHLEDGQEVKEGAKVLSVVISGSPPIMNKTPVQVKSNTLRLGTIIPIDLVQARPPFEAVTLSSALNCIRDVCIEILTEARKYF
ncbi:MAG: hypothetical protein QM730_20935 [Anaerolineales bacterium]